MEPQPISRSARAFQRVSTLAGAPGQYRLRSCAADAGSALEFGALDDAGLLALVVDERDEAAFSEFYRRKARPVYSLIRRRIVDRGMADEAAQDAFTAVWRSARGYRPARGAVDAWLFTIARHAAYDVMRRRRPVVVGEAPDPVDPSLSPDEAVLAEMENFRVHAAVDRPRAESVKSSSVPTFRRCRRARSPPIWVCRWERSRPETAVRSDAWRTCSTHDGDRSG